MKTVILSIGLVLLLSFTPIKAEIIQIGLTGLVDYVDDPYNLLGSGVTEGAQITGFYIYDSETPDSEPSVEFGIYKHTSTPYIMSLTIGSLIFQTNPTNVDLVIGLTNNYSGGSWDSYGVTSYNNLTLDNGVSIDRLHWQLDDYSGTALSSDALPTTPPVLSQWQSNQLSVRGGMYPFPPDGTKTLFGINGHVTSVYLIPEPASLILLATGGLLLNRKDNRGQLPIIFLFAFLN
jgi:hypothetical protein